MIELKIDKEDIICYLLCFAFIPLEVIQLKIGSIGYIFFSLPACLYVYLITLRDMPLLKSKQFMIWMGLLVWLLICNVMNRQSLIWPFYYVGKVAFWYLINDWYLENGSLRLLKASRNFVGLATIITIAQQFIAPGIFGYTEGMNARNFLVSDNFLGYYYTSLIALSFILDFVENRKTRFSTYLITLICFVSLIRAWSVKSMVGIGLILVYIIFVYKKNISRIFNAKVLLVIFALIFFGVVFFNVQENYMDFFSKYFGKDSSVSVRYYVWKQAINNIKARPLFGYGIREGQRLTLQQTWQGHARASHNIVLELLLEGGFIGFGIYLVSIFYAVGHKNNLTDYRYEYLFLVFVIFIFYIMQLASGSVYYPFYYMPLILINNIDRIDEIKEQLIFNE